MKIFSKEIEPYCIYCVHSKPIGSMQVICPKHGIVSTNYHCRKYKYDPTKRIPPEPAAMDIECFTAEDFKIG